MNIRIKSLKINNFKGIEELKLDFKYLNSDEVLDNIVIYGINGAGKSTILEAIYLSLIVATTYQNRKDLEKIENYLIDSISLGSEWIYNNRDEFTISIEILEASNSKTGTLKYNKDSGLSWSITPKLSISFGKPFTFLSSYRLLNPTTIQTAGDWEEIERIEYFSRRAGAYLNGRSRRDSQVFPSLSLQFDNNYKTVKQHLVNLITDKQVGAITEDGIETLEKIKEAFKIFFPEKEFLEKLSRTERLKDYRLNIKNEDGSVVDLDQLSSGEREVIAFFTYLCIKALNSSILIIDEPELHLHPKWQTIIVYAIHKLFPNTQLFIATHSKEIHQSASESELFELKKAEI